MTPVPPIAAIERALVEAAGNVAAAARTLGIASAYLRGVVRAHPLLADAATGLIDDPRMVRCDVAQGVDLVPRSSRYTSGISSTAV
jgi:hypothetical protein